ncbi:unnamed protein product, partial [Mesorhabditis belari]|uniref:Peptide-N(4)-(N-acetyl-beta-glucosaminyl)asparagine amidase n=1 Tax=Mesorhabditis belari TaxID=2138241 RepID=A0AAF3FD01_9BILA
MPVEIRAFADLQRIIADAGASKLLICDFYADWCGPCRMIAPLFEQLSQQFPDAVFCKINVDNCRDVMTFYRVRAMPTFVFLKNNVEVERMEGANPQRLQQIISTHYTADNPNAATELERNFLRLFESASNKMQIYKDEVNQTLALSLIPNERLRADSMIDEKVNLFHLLKNLTEWFKVEFFSWTDTPKCECGEVTSRNTYKEGTPTAEESSYGADRVEVYTCKCGKDVRFPRYNDPTKLLETRNGRCGEWANCFTLCAAAMGFDVRYIYDVTDHVWCEVWVPELDRWVHVDPCENLIDSPLVYELGWKKSLSYVAAFGFDHAYDVTWRYISDARKTKKRRTAVRETVLQNFLTKLSNRMSKDATQQRKDELSQRRLRELIELLHIAPRTDSKNYGGRISGDERWKKERGEGGSCTTSPKRKQIVIRPNDQEMSKKKFTLSYNVVKDAYLRGETASKGFHSMVFKSKDIQLKKEFDWKKAYLCRKEGKDEGEICWTVDLTGLKAKRAFLKVDGMATFEGGKLTMTVCADDVCMRVPASGELIFDDPPSTMLQIKAHLSGGRGENAFQHTQLFRASLVEATETSQMQIEIDFE